jgi:serine protease Do
MEQHTETAQRPATGLTPPPPPKHPRRAFPASIVVAVASAALASVMTLGLAGLMVPAPAADEASATTATAARVTTVAQTDTSEPVVQVAAAVKPAVVTITSTATRADRGSAAIPATGVGSGVIFASDGWILTNRHVIEGSDELTVTLADGRELSGSVVATDQTLDLAIVRVDATGLPTAKIGSSADLRVGQTVIAIGSPLGEFTETVTAGILSATGRSITVRDARTGQPVEMTDLLQTDAAINEGNSGGPLLDIDGTVIGVNSAAASSAEGIGFAIPIDEALALMERASGAELS